LTQHVHQLSIRCPYHLTRAFDNDDEEEELEDFEEETSSDDDDDTDGAYDEDPIVASTDPSDWVEVGVIGPPHGVRGEFKMQPLTDFPEERLGEPGPRWLQAPAPKFGKLSSRSPPEPMDLEWGRTTIYKGRELWIVKLEGIDSPEEAQLVRGHVLLIPAAARDPLDDEDEFYVQELVGLRVFIESSGEEVGKVVDLFDGTGTYDVLRIELRSSFGVNKEERKEEEEEEEEKKEASKKSGSGGGKRQVMLPFVKELVPIIDLKEGFMRVDPPAGLFDLATEAPVKQKRRENAGKRERRNSRPTYTNNKTSTEGATQGSSSLAAAVAAEFREFED
jgi:16S rRNA processing protein RimM